MGGSTKTVQHSIKNISRNIKQCSLNLAPDIYITKETKWKPPCRCHCNSYAAGPVLITTKTPTFDLKHRSSIFNPLIRRVNTMWEPCVFRGKRPVPLKKDANGDIWFFTERDWSQECCHSNNIVVVLLFLLWCIFLLSSLKITAPIFYNTFVWLGVYYTPSHTDVCKFFSFQHTFSQLIFHLKCWNLAGLLKLRCSF